ncbi:MAG: hypothetical protein WD995_11520 [Gemmatimonadota bacterium]
MRASRSRRITLEYDDRQALVQLRREMEADLVENRASINERREALEELGRDFEELNRRSQEWERGGRPGPRRRAATARRFGR